jgi:hypothetical protein
MKDELEITYAETLNQPLEVLEVARVEDGSFDRLLKIHQAAQLELKDLEADFQCRLQESLMQTEFHFEEKFAAANQDFQRREQEIQAIANEKLQKATEEFDAERKEFQQRIAALEEQISSSQKTAQQQVIRTPLSRQLEMKLEEVTREKARLEEELHRRKADGQRLEKLKTSKTLPQLWEL